MVYVCDYLLFWMFLVFDSFNCWLLLELLFVFIALLFWCFLYRLLGFTGSFAGLTWLFGFA